MSFAAERERRSTAGQRMSNLVGKALDDDEAFWGHDTWADEGDESGNDSFRESDEDSENRVDQFDSDFDESESDHEDEEAAAGMDEEMQLRRDERVMKRKQKFDIAKAGRDLMKKKKGKGKTRIMGSGDNAGLVLNFPGKMALPSAPLPMPVPSSAPSVAQTPAKASPQPATARKSGRLNQTSARRNLRAATHHKTIQAETQRKSVSSSTAAPPKKKQRRFTQEEMLLEAATKTEPENQRWLLGRKRVEEMTNNSLKLETSSRGKVIYKFHSRRGCPNTLTFSDMDHVPDILARKEAPRKRASSSGSSVCVITGKAARFRDPKTMMGYYDKEAFRELRRRQEAGEPLDQRVREKTDEQKRPGQITDMDSAQSDVSMSHLTRCEVSETTQLSSNGVDRHASLARKPKSSGIPKEDSTKGRVSPNGPEAAIWAPEKGSSAAAGPKPNDFSSAKDIPVATDPKAATRIGASPSRATIAAPSSTRQKRLTPKAALAVASEVSSLRPANAIPSRNDSKSEPQSVSPEITNSSVASAVPKPLLTLQQSSK